MLPVEYHVVPELKVASFKQQHIFATQCREMVSSAADAVADPSANHDDLCVRQISFIRIDRT